jgi:hypothetical protein
MRVPTRFIIALLIVLSFIQSSFAQSRYENGCPCDTVGKLDNYVKSSSHEVKRIAASLFRSDGSVDWAIARIHVQKIVGLVREGITDSSQPLDAYFMTYAADNRSRLQSTSWAHQYGLDTWPLVDYGQFEELKEKGYSRYENIKRAIAAKKFLLVAHTGGDIPPADIVLTNTIFFDHANMPQYYDRLIKIIDRFLKSNPPTSLNNVHNVYLGGMLYIVSSSKNGEEVIVIFEIPFINGLPWRTDHGSYFVGRAHTISRDNTAALEALRVKLPAIQRVGGRVYYYGDQIKSIDIEGLAQSYGVDLVRRGPTIIKDFARTEKRLEEIENTGFKKKTTVLLNGIPKSQDELRGPLQLNSLAGWQESYQRVESIMQGRHHDRIETKQQFFRELQEGTSDVLLLVAHSDGKSIYFNNERVSADELNALPDRQNLGSRARLAILISCSTGSLSRGRGPWLLKEPELIGEILVNKGFFDAVIAPDHEISVDEGLEALNDILRGRESYAIRSTYKGWRKLAQIKIYVRKRDI